MAYTTISETRGALETFGQVDALLPDALPDGLLVAQSGACVMSRTPRAGLIGLIATLGLTACGDETADGSGPQTITVTGIDYAFEELPEQATAGSTLTLTNASEEEVHEILAIRIDDASGVSVEQLVELPDDELDEHLAPEPPATIIVAMPGEDGATVVGDGALTEPGRSALVCFIPTGADPGEIQAAFESEQEGPPDIEGGDPHALLGMHAELTVVGD